MTQWIHKVLTLVLYFSLSRLAKFIASLMLASTTFGQSQFVEYSQAYQTSVKENRPLVVLVSAKWCLPCQSLKREIQKLEKSETERIVLSIVDYDRDQALAKQVMRGSTLPQLVGYSRDDSGEWRRYGGLVGAQSLDKVRELIQRVTASRKHP